MLRSVRVCVSVAIKFSSHGTICLIIGTKSKSYGGVARSRITDRRSIDIAESEQDAQLGRERDREQQRALRAPSPSPTGIAAGQGTEPGGMC
ncbi:hypothetical protein B4Q13_23235 [Lacticaseibacillus rhamnosus]